MTTALSELDLIARGKVREMYALEDDIVMVASDRISAYDVILPTPIPDKGRVLSQMSVFWFESTGSIVPNHFISEDVPPEAEGRGLRVKRLEMYPVECVVRGYITGSGWKDYQRSGEICGLRLPAGLRMADRLPEPIFTPSTKAERGQHDENVGFAHVEALIGAELAAQVRDTAIALYRFAAERALARGIIIADTKFEFGIDGTGALTLIDEALTPDSSRFWPVDTYRPGMSPPSFDKQFVRDYLETLDWDKRPPAPRLPVDVIRRTGEKYQEALLRLTGDG
jgi:phosphoribosylaminoimidazole-succinocarboxamide synthase